MKRLIRGEIHPYVFHMNWNLDTKTKREFDQQLGDWYVSSVSSLLEKSSSTSEQQQRTADESSSSSNLLLLTIDRCLTEPHIVCHYRDKPSKIRCDDSPLIEGSESFW
jgi:hypothetical protein